MALSASVLAEVSSSILLDSSASPFSLANFSLLISAQRLVSAVFLLLSSSSSLLDNSVSPLILACVSALMASLISDSLSSLSFLSFSMIGIMVLSILSMARSSTLTNAWSQFSVVYTLYDKLFWTTVGISTSTHSFSPSSLDQQMVLTSLLPLIEQLSSTITVSPSFIGLFSQ